MQILPLLWLNCTVCAKPAGSTSKYGMCAQKLNIFTAAVMQYVRANSLRTY